LNAFFVKFHFWHSLTLYIKLAFLRRRRHPPPVLPACGVAHSIFGVVKSSPDRGAGPSFDHTGPLEHWSRWWWKVSPPWQGHTKGVFDLYLPLCK